MTTLVFVFAARSTSLVRGTAAIVALAATLLVACHKAPVPATQVLVAITSDLEPVSELSRIEITLSKRDGSDVVSMEDFTLVESHPKPGQQKLPLTFSIGKGNEESFLLVVSGYGSLSPGGAETRIVEQRYIATFQNQKTLLLQVFLGRVCLNQLCDTNGMQVCYTSNTGKVRAGECGQIVPLDSNDLKPIDVAMVPDLTLPPKGTKQISAKDAAVIDASADAGTIDGGGVAGASGTSGNAGTGGGAGGGTAGATSSGGTGTAGQGGTGGKPSSTSCADNHGDCDPLASCIDVAGAPSCGPCPAYYRGDGTSCVHLYSLQLGTSTYDTATSIAIDTNANLFVAGETLGALDGNTNAGDEDFLVVKYDGTGQKQWTRELGTAAGKDEAHGVATDATGNVYVAGMTQGALDGNSSAGSADIFLMKYDNVGQKQWTRQFGTSTVEMANHVATDASGNIYAAGFTLGVLDGAANAGSGDVVVFKYDGSGQMQWIRQLGTSGNDIAYGIATDASGNVYVVGSAEGDLDGNTSTGGIDAFLIKYDGAGQKQWTRELGTNAGDYALGVATDASGNAYVTGYTGGALDGTTNQGGDDLFLAKYDPTGQKQWTRQLGTSGADQAAGVAVDAGGDVYVVGHTAGNLDGNTSAGGSDLFVIQYDEAGQKQWTRQLGTSVDDSATGVATDVHGNAYVTGNTAGAFDDNTAAGNYDLFIIAYDRDGKRL